LRDGFIAGLAGRHEFALCLTGSSDRSLVRGVLSVALAAIGKKAFEKAMNASEYRKEALTQKGAAAGR
jgi:hypothetical protein